MQQDLLQTAEKRIYKFSTKIHECGTVGKNISKSKVGQIAWKEYKKIIYVSACGVLKIGNFVNFMNLQSN